MSKFDYRVGSVIRYRFFGNKFRTVFRTVKVDEKSSDIKDGRPGFGGQTTDGVDCWGYDDEIVEVITY